MAKTDVHWQEHKGKAGDAITVSELGKWTFSVPARLFYNIARKGVALLREHHYGTFMGADELSLKVRKARGEYDGLFIVTIYVNDENMVDIWCDKITHIENNYLLYLKGTNICGVAAEKVEIDDELMRSINR